MMTWVDFKLKFSKYHVPPGLIKKMRDEFRELKQGRMTVVEYRDKFLTLSRYAPDETDTTDKRKERFLNGLHDEMQTVLVNIPFADLEALVDSAIQMEGKLNQANENRKRRMMQSGPSNTPRYRPSSSGGFAPRSNKPPTQMSRPGFQNRSGGNPRPGGHHNNTHSNSNYVHHNNNFNRAPMRAPANNNNTNTAPRTGSNAVPVAPKDKATITCYECGVVGHYSNECPKRLAKIAANTAAPAQQQRRVSTGKKFTPNNPNNRSGRLFHMSAEEAQEAPDVVLDRDIEFIIELIPGTGPIAQRAYSMNPAELVELKKQLDDMLEKGSFLDATIAKSRQIENTETPNENAATPVNSPESVEYSSDDLDEDYVELDDDFIEKCNATTDARKIKKLLAEHAVRYKLSPDPKFATSPINIRDKDYDFSLDLSHIAIVEKTPFCGTEKESAVEHMTELSTLSGLFSDDIKMRTYFVAKIFPFSLKDDAKTWYNNLPPGSIKSPKELLDVFFRKYFPASAQHAALQRIYNFDQEDGEKLPEAWARFCSLIRAQPDHDLEKHDLLDIFYSGLTIESRAYLDSCAGCVFRKRTPDDAEELLAKIGRNHDDWSTPEPTPTPIVKKRGMIKLNDEDMREAKKSLKEKGIKPEDVKNLPPIEDLCEITPPSSMIEDPLYPEGHPKRVEQDSQLTKTSAPSKKKKKKHKNVVESSEPVNDPNSISISDAETESGNEHDKDNDKDDTPDKEEVEEEPEKHAKNKKYTKEDFIAEKHDHGAPSINFNQFLEKEKLKGNGSNFTDWFRHVRIFLAGVSLQYVLEAPLGSPPPPAVSEDIKNVYETRATRYSEVQCAILCSLEAELQKRFEHHDPCEMMRELKLIFETHAAVESYEASKQFFNCMMEEGSSVSEHMFAMSGHAKKLSDLGIVIPNKLGIHRVLQSLPPSYKNFVMNYNMQNMNKELPELFSMLKSAEVEIKKENQVLMVNKTTSFKKQGKPNKGNFKKGGKKVAAPPEKPKAGPKPETVCYYCQGKGHWKRN
ncbi:hypothetical protein QYE76_012505 [Lolium multiflorum]|uniref:CCHC-type domain-containing protein n=1 Tax=Lolium multiflorum TaxID=4521 RepID=A0AAD8X3Q5_LOLMU|nr:hypothetical protein QYE76_012505 [Lolium multiflorum]